MASKKFFIRKSHKELVQEQNSLLERLLSKQKEDILSDSPYAYSYQPSLSVPAVEEIDTNFDTLPFMPTGIKSSKASLLSVSTTKSSLDEEGIAKLKTRKNDKA